MAIQQLKLNKASGYDDLLAELFKGSGDELVRCMHHLLCNIWSLESMSSDWSLSLLRPVFKKGDATIFSNYRGIRLLMIAYRILSSVLCERLKPFLDKMIGCYQCGFRPEEATVDHSFMLLQFLEQIDTHNLFVTYTPPCLSLAYLRN